MRCGCGGRWVRLQAGIGALELVQSAGECWAPVKAPASAANERDPLGKQKEKMWLREAAPDWYEVREAAM